MEEFTPETTSGMDCIGDREVGDWDKINRHLVRGDGLKCNSYKWITKRRRKVGNATHGTDKMSRNIEITTLSRTVCHARVIYVRSTHYLI